MEHDSLEDYLSISEEIKASGNCNVENTLTLNQKRKICERRALGIVNLLIERSVTTDIFLKVLFHLNSSYYQDISEERALLNLCGYPLCKNIISKPKCRYKILSNAKKVYDLDEYGNFCSIFCFNANNHIKSQIVDSPLWLRDLEEPPKYTLLTKTSTSCNADGINIKSKRAEKTREFTTISSFAKLSLDDIGDTKLSISALKKEQNDPGIEKPIDMVTQNKRYNVMEQIIEESEKCKNDHLEITESNCDISSMNVNSEEHTKFGTENSTNSKTEITQGHGQNVNHNVKEVKKVFRSSNQIQRCEKAPIKNLKSIANKIKDKQQKRISLLIDPLPLNVGKSEGGPLEKQVEQKKKLMGRKSLMELKFLSKDTAAIENSLKIVFNRWITLETLMFIHGEDKIKAKLDENKLSEHFEKLKVNKLELDQQEKYVSICRKLCEQEVFEDKIEPLLLKNNLRPIPDYNQLKNENKEFDIKVKTFFSGQLHESDDKNFGTLRTNKIENPNHDPHFTPSSDEDSPNGLRQKILYDSLKRSVQFFLDYINYDSTDVLTNMKYLIKTFELDATNLVFKPIIQNYISFVCLKILSLNNDRLRKRLQRDESEELEDYIFQQFPEKKAVLVNILNLINDVEKFLESYISTKD